MAERFNKPLASAAQDREQAGNDAHRDVRRRRRSLAHWSSTTNGRVMLTEMGQEDSVGGVGVRMVLERVLWSGVLKGDKECLLPHLALNGISPKMYS